MTVKERQYCLVCKRESECVIFLNSEKMCEHCGSSELVSYETLEDARIIAMHVTSEDTIVLMVNACLASDAKQRLICAVHEYLPDNKIMVLDQGIGIGILRPGGGAP